MGQCCKLEALPVPKISIAAAPVSGAFPGIQPYKVFTNRYEDIQVVHTSSSHTRGRVSEIRARTSGFLYVCRRAPFIEAPMRFSPEIINRHLEILCELDHPHLCACVECFSDEESGDWLLVSERADPPPLLDFVEEQGLPNGDLDAAEIVRQILSVLAHGHARGIAHGRLRYNCVLLSASDGGGRRTTVKDKEKEKEKGGTPQVKICDMGLGYVLRPPISSASAAYDGLLYMPPENAWKEVELPCIEDSQPDAVNDASSFTASSRGAFAPAVISSGVAEAVHASASKQDERRGASPHDALKADIWAVGVFTFNLLSGLLPFEASDDEKLMEKLRTQGVKFTRDPWQEMSSKAVDVIQSMLRVDPKLRPSAGDLLKHNWLKLSRSRVAKSRIFNLYRNAIVNFHECQFKKLVIRVIIEQLPRSHEHIKEVMTVFQALDYDADGLLNYKEFSHGLKKLPDLNKHLADPVALFEAADRNCSGALDANEFAAATFPPAQARDEKNLWSAFRAFDKDEDGVISLEEVEDVVRLLEGRLLAPAQLEELCAVIRSELEDLNIGDDWMADAGRARDLSEDTSFLRKACVRVKSILPLGSRTLDFGEFSYLCATRPVDCKVKPWSRKEIFRYADLCCDIDMYHLAHRQNQLQWPPKEGSSARGPRSAYERSGLTADSTRRRRSRATTMHRWDGASPGAAGDEKKPIRARGSSRHSPRKSTIKPHGEHHHHHHHHHHGEHNHHDHQKGDRSHRSDGKSDGTSGTSRSQSARSDATSIWSIDSPVASPRSTSKESSKGSTARKTKRRQTSDRDSETSTDREMD